MKLRRAQILTLFLCLLLVGLADAQGRGRKGGGRGGRGGGGGRQNNGAEAQRAKKAEANAEKQAQKQKQQNAKRAKSWAEQQKKRAEARQAAMRAKQKGPVEIATFYRSNCSACHVVPDPALPADSLWLAGIATTQCRDLTPELREELAEFLRGAETFRPHAIASHAVPAPGQASVTSKLEGEVFLRAESGAYYRLQWGPGQAGEQRVIAPGKYRLCGYRVVKDGVTLSASGGQRSIAVQPDQHLPLRLEPELEIDLSATPGPGRGGSNTVGLAFALRDSHGQAISVYRNGTRVPISFAIETESGPTQQGVMAYTSEGRAAAEIEVPVGQPAFARVGLPRLPFPVGGSPRVALPAQP
jgi:hypothetical protein